MTEQPSKHHVIITGAGRSGTTFLVKLLTRLDLPTGFTEPQLQTDPASNAGLERNPFDPDAPYICKTPYMCEYLGEFLDKGTAVIDHAIVPMRGLFESAESRRANVRKSPGMLPSAVTGGLFGTDDPVKQEEALCMRLFNLMETLAKHDIPLTLLHYWKLCDAQYVHKKLAFLLNGISYDQFALVHQMTFKQELQHRYAKA